MRRSVVPLTLALALAGCAASDARPPAAPGPTLVEPTSHRPPPDFAPLPRDLKVLGSIVTRWTADGGPRVALTSTRTFQLLERRGVLRALDNRNGEPTWTVSVDPTPEGQPWVAGGQVILPTRTGLSAFDPATGAPRWRWPGVLADLRVTPGRVFVLGAPAGSNPQVSELDPRDGRVRWSLPCRATCALVDARDDALLVAPHPGRLLRVEAGRITATVDGLKRLRRAALTSDGLLVATSTAVVRRDTAGVRFSVAAPQVRDVVALGPHLLLDAGDALLGLDPNTGATRWRIGLDDALQGRLRLPLAAHFPEGQLLVPTEDLFGLAPVYLLVRDDGTLRVLRYGHPDLHRLQTLGPLALYASRDQIVLSGTRRRGAPVRHYETPAADVAAQLARLSAPALDPETFAAQGDARAWLRRLGRPVVAQPLHAAIAAAPPAALAGLLLALDPEDPTDAAVRTQATWRLLIAEGGPAVEQGRQWGLSNLRTPWPDALWRRLLDEAPRWLRALPPAALAPGARTPPHWRAAPQNPAAAARAHVQAALDVLGVVQAQAFGAGYSVALWRALGPEVAARARRGATCPWPDALAHQTWPVPPRCPLLAPPPGATLDPSAAVAVWRAGAAGDPDDVWTMVRRGREWSPPYFTGLQAPRPLEVRARGRGFELVAGETTTPLPALARLSRDRDRDGLTDLLEARLGTAPGRADSDRDGLADAVDPAPGCPAGAAADASEALRTAVAQTAAALDLSPGPRWDASPRCLSASLLAGPLWRTAQAPLRAGHVVSAEVLTGERRRAAIATATASGQLAPGAYADPDLTVIRSSVAGPDRAPRAATLIFVRIGARYRGAAVVDATLGSLSVAPRPATR